VSTDAPQRREFDGVVCFGGLDWWYHNRGHYDLQMMRELSRVVPVLYVNSIAMRMPRVSEGRQFVKRIVRKLGSLRRGLVKVRPSFGVFSPFALPGPIGTPLSRPFVPLQIQRAAFAMGIRRPLLWVACPPADRFLDALGPVGVVYQRTDRYEAFAGVDPEFIGSCNASLVQRADLTLYCSSLLMEEEGERCRRAAFLDHGVDYDAFASAGTAEDGVPADVAALPGPRVGFVGGIDAHTFDPELFLAVARQLPEASFVLVGSCSLPEDWCDLPNVHLLGQRPYEEVARYMAASDVLIMPWNKSDWVAACNPVKLKEYLAVGRPIVSTGFHELKGYTGLVRVADDADAFAAAVREALAQPGDPEAGRARVREATWERRGHELLGLLEESGLVLSLTGGGVR
jgi:glycosyltransferase involved in cell wall biosynthesis